MVYCIHWTKYFELLRTGLLINRTSTLGRTQNIEIFELFLMLGLHYFKIPVSFRIPLKRNCTK